MSAKRQTLPFPKFDKASLTTWYNLRTQEETVSQK